MHRKKIRRWHKLLSVSAVFSFIVGSSLVSGANAQMNPPWTDGVYGPTYSNQDTITFYLDFDQNINDFKADDLTFRGTATGCLISTIPNVFAFSFGFQISGCSDGTVAYDLRKNAVFNADGVWGPVDIVYGLSTTINRQPFALSIKPIPNETAVDTLSWEVETNHLVKTVDVSKILVDGTGCQFSDKQIIDPTGLYVTVTGCEHGTTATLSLAPNALKDYLGQLAPSNGLTSMPYVVQQGVLPLDASPTPTPTPTPSSSPTAMSPLLDPTPSPTATPTATADPTPTPNSTPSDSPSSVAVVQPPTEPPPPPTAQESPVSQPQQAVELPQEPLVTAPEALPLVQPKRVKVLLPIVPIVEQQPQQVIESAPSVPVIETQVKPQFNWQPIGNIAIALGLTSGAVGMTIALRKVVRVRRLKFS